MTTKQGYKNAFGMFINTKYAYEFYKYIYSTLDVKTEPNVFNNIRYFVEYLMYYDKIESNDNKKIEFKDKIIESTNSCKNILNEKSKLKLKNWIIKIIT